MDVEASIHIRSGPAAVAAIMFDPRRDPEWIGGAKSVETLMGNPVATGAKVRRHGEFLGRKFSWVTEVTGHVPDRLLRMAFVEGPMKGGEVVYRIEPDGAGSLVSIRNRAGLGFSIPGLGWFVRRSVAKDLERLARLVEG